MLLAALALLTAAPPAPAHAQGIALAGSHTSFARVGIGGFRRPGFGSRGRGFGYRRPGRGRGIFRSIIRALAIGYLLHLLFTTPGGLLVLVLMIGAVLALMSRFRRRRTVRW